MFCKVQLTGLQMSFFRMAYCLKLSTGRMPLLPALLVMATLATSLPWASSAEASSYVKPWRDREKALVLDAYELNSIDWLEVVKDKRIAGFIAKASDGLSAEYCSDRQTLCGAKWRKYFVTKELYHTRRMLAKALGLKWGAYHLGRTGNPEQQALHFLQFAKPEPDEVIVLDIESLDSTKYMSLKEAERFSRYIYSKLGRYPMLYTNHQTSSFIAANRKDYPLLSRMKLWYARYKDDIRGVFPMGNWNSYTIWQFAYGGNCSKKSCPYRVKGTPLDIDVNATHLTVRELKEQWPFDGLHDEQPLDGTDEAETILVRNEVGYPEEEKHSDFVADIDYVNPVLDELTTAQTATETISAYVGPARATPKTNRLPGAVRRDEEKCDLDLAKLDSDDLLNC